MRAPSWRNSAVTPTPSAPRASRLIVALLVAALVTGFATSADSASASVVAVSPQEAAAVTRGGTVTLSVQAPGGPWPSGMTFNVSRSPALDANGILGHDVSSDLNYYSPDGIYTSHFTATQQVGTVYWQASHCTASGTTCTGGVDASPVH